jgi:hypothetical protein
MVVAEAVTPGEAVFGLLRPVPGLHVYDVPPLAVRLALSPTHMLTELTAGVKLNTLTVCVACAVQPLPALTVKLMVNTPFDV